MNKTIFEMDQMSVKARQKLERNGFKFINMRIEADIVYTQLSHVRVIDHDKTVVVATPCTGTDHISINRKGCKLLHLDSEWKQTDGSGVFATAELALMLMLMLAREADTVTKMLNRPRTPGIELAGKTLGIIGYGRIGKMVARYGQAMGMRVIAYDIREEIYDPEEEAEVELVDLDTLLVASDVISIHVPLDKTTRHMISKQEFEFMKDSVILVNTSRGEIVDEYSLLDKINKSDMRFASDFLVHPLISRHPRAVVTPHIGGYTKEAREATDMYIADRLIEMFEEDDDEL